MGKYDEERKALKSESKSRYAIERENIYKEAPSGFDSIAAPSKYSLFDKPDPTPKVNTPLSSVPKTYSDYNRDILGKQLPSAYNLKEPSPIIKDINYKYMNADEAKRYDELDKKRKLSPLLLTKSEKDELGSLDALNNLQNKFDVNKQNAEINQYKPSVGEKLSSAAKSVDTTVKNVSNALNIVNAVDNAHEQALREAKANGSASNLFDVSMRTLGSIPTNWAPTNKILYAAHDALGLPFVDAAGNEIKRQSTGLGIVDKALELAGNLGGYAMQGGGAGSEVNPLTFTDKGAEYVAGKVASKLGAVPKIIQSFVPAFVRGAIDNGTFAAAEDIGNGKDLKTIAKDTAENAAFGGGLFALGKGIYDKATGKFEPEKQPVILPDVPQKNISTFEVKSPNNVKLADNLNVKLSEEPLKDNLIKKYENPTEPIKGTFKVNTELQNATKAWNDFVTEAQNKYGHYQLTDDEILNYAIEKNVDPFKLIDDMKNASSSLDLSNVPDASKLAERNRMAKIAGVDLNIPKLQKPLELKHPLAKDTLTSKASDTLVQGEQLPINSKIEYTDIFNFSKKNKGIITKYETDPLTKKTVAKIQKLDDSGNPAIVNGKPVIDSITLTDDLNLISPDSSVTKASANAVNKAEDGAVKGNRLSSEQLDSLIANSDSWKDKSVLGLGRETWDRNIIDIAGKEDGQRIKESIFDPIHENEAKRIRFMNEWREKIKALKLTAKESEAVQKFGEGKYYEDGGKDILNGKQINIEHTYQLDDLKKDFPNSWEKIVNATKVFTDFYTKVYPFINESLERNGYKSIGKIDNYFPHFTKDNPLLKALGVNLNVKDLPTDINGLTHEFKPGKNWVGNFLKRTGDMTDFGAVEGFDRYIEGASKVIFHTDDIKNLREFNKTLRLKYSKPEIQSQVEKLLNDTELDEDTKNTAINELLGRSEFKLSNAVANLEEFTNKLAGKQDLADRAWESGIGRKIYNISNTVMNRIAGNMVAINPASWITNFIPLTQSLATTGKKEFIQALGDTLKSVLHDDGFVNKSTFLTNREGSEILSKSKLDKLGSALSVPMKWIDSFTANVVTRSKYLEGLHSGLSEKEALKKANEWAAKLMGDRSLGAQPRLFNIKNPLYRAFTQFQLEVNNQVSFLLKDLPREYLSDSKNVKSIAKLTSVVGQMALYGYLYNLFYQSVIGRKPALDPIGSALDLKSDLNNPNLKSTDIAANLIGNITNQLPFISTFTGGRIPVSQGLPDIYGVVTGNKDMKTELSKPLYYLLPPFGGSQVKKTIEAKQAIDNKGIYTNNGTQLKYPVDNSFKALLFGTSSLPESQNYYNNKLSPLSEKNTDKYKELIKTMSPKDAYDKLQISMEVNQKKNELYKYLDTTTLSDKEKKRYKTKIGDDVSYLKKMNNSDEAIINELERMKEYYKKQIEK